tara:strand:- start:1648 stop:1995 length:348 start_codon:yes stop_codon:yes gene_type:complete
MKTKFKKEKLTKKEWREAVTILRHECPPHYPVKARRVKVPDDIYGDTDLKELKNGKRFFMIRVSQELSKAETLEVLVHEWAHAISWTSGHGRIRDHGAEWGLAYASAYRAIYQVD